MNVFVCKINFSGFFRENDPEIPELQKQLRLMQTRLAQKQVVGPEGGN